MSKTVRIGFLSAHNPHDRTSFSGVPYYMLRALRAHPQVEVRVMGNHPDLMPGVAGRVQRRLARGRRIDWSRVEVPAGVDFLLGVVSSGLITEQAARTRIPIFHVTDATPGFLREFYNPDLGPEADRGEAECLAAAAAVIYSSDYMAARALQEFPTLDPARVHTFPFGLNLDRTPPKVPPKPALAPLNLLFIGGDWARKGGPLAVAVLDTLRRRGVDATLTVIGNREAGDLRHPHIRCLGFVEKNKSKGRRTFARELARAHLLLHPTRADCSAMVVAEANAYGCPVAVTDVGGIPSVMAPDRNGAMFRLEDGPEEIADVVMSLVGDPDRFRTLSETSRAHFENNLTWAGWVDKVLKTAREMGIVDTARVAAV